MMLAPVRPPTSAVSPPGGIAVVVLLDADREAQSFAHLLDDVRLPGGDAAVLVPPVRGLRFFADGAVQPEIDSWWAANVDRRALPLWVAEHQPGLEGWVDSVDGLFVIAGDEMEAYARSPRVTCVPQAVPLDVLGAVIRELGGSPAPEPSRPASRTSRRRFRRARLQAGDDLAVPSGREDAAAQLFEPTGVPRGGPGGVCDELIDVLGDAMLRIRELAGAASGASVR
jgi:hypothetical protein